MQITAHSKVSIWRSSDLSKRPAAVFAEAENRPVIVTRRDGEPLVLMSQREADASSELLQFAATIVSAVLYSGPLTERMSRHYLWMSALSDKDQELCARDLLDAARASFATRQAHLVTSRFLSWRETATAIAAGLGTEPVEWIDEGDGSDKHTVVERP